MLTAEGVQTLWEAFEFILRVSDGTTTASTRATTVEVRQADVDGESYAVLHLEGEFGSSEANFEWRRRDVALVVPGQSDVTLDRDTIDLGRKAEGGVWTVVADIALRVQGA